MIARTLYIVDDNVDFLDSTRFWLSSDDLEVRTCGNPAQAIEAITQRDRSRTACLMLDIRMPGMSGLELHDALIERDADLPVIYMSGHADVPLAVRAMQKGAVTLLEKPFDEAMLEEALDQAFAGSRRSLPVVTGGPRWMPPSLPPHRPPSARQSRPIPPTPKRSRGSRHVRLGCPHESARCSTT